MAQQTIILWWIVMCKHVEWMSLRYVISMKQTHNISLHLVMSSGFADIKVALPNLIQDAFEAFF